MKVTPSFKEHAQEKARSAGLSLTEWMMTTCGGDPTPVRSIAFAKIQTPLTVPQHVKDVWYMQAIQENKTLSTWIVDTIESEKTPRPHTYYKGQKIYRGDITGDGEVVYVPAFKPHLQWMIQTEHDGLIQVHDKTYLDTMVKVNISLSPSVKHDYKFQAKINNMSMSTWIMSMIA